MLVCFISLVLVFISSESEMTTSSSSQSSNCLSDWLAESADSSAAVSLNSQKINIQVLFCSCDPTYYFMSVWDYIWPRSTERRDGFQMKWKNPCRQPRRQGSRSCQRAAPLRWNGFPWRLSSWDWGRCPRCVSTNPGAGPGLRTRITTSPSTPPPTPTPTPTLRPTPCYEYDGYWHYLTECVGHCCSIPACWDGYGYWDIGNRPFNC